MARRFIVEKKDIVNIDENSICIKGSEVKHIQVLRHKIDDEIIVNEFICKILEIRKDSILLSKVKLAPRVGEPNINLTLYLAMLKGEKMDMAIQKAVELGCKKIVPFFSKNVIVKLDDKAKNKRKEKLQVIANEACKQCGRTDAVEIRDFIFFNEMVNNLENYDICFFAYENEKVSLHEIIDNEKEHRLNHIACVIGPEGGFDISEVQKLIQIPNVKCVSLGTRILRAETAVYNLVSIIMYEFDK